MNTNKLVTTVVSSVFALFALAACSGAPGESSATGEDELTKQGGGGGTGVNNICGTVHLPAGGLLFSYVDPNPDMNTFIDLLEVAGCRGTGGETQFAARAVAKANDSTEWWVESECPVNLQSWVQTNLVNNPHFNVSPIRATINPASSLQAGTCGTIGVTPGYFVIDFDPGCPGCTLSGGHT